MNKRFFLQTISLYFFSFFVSNRLFALGNPKIINPNLTEEQKKIMFGEGTERAGTKIGDRELRDRDRGGIWVR